MTKKIILLIAFLVTLLDLSSCRMRDIPGIQRGWHTSRRFHRHWGRERHMNIRHSFWGNHRWGMRPHNYRGHFH